MQTSESQFLILIGLCSEVEFTNSTFSILRNPNNIFHSKNVIVRHMQILRLLHVLLTTDIFCLTKDLLKSHSHFNGCEVAGHGYCFIFISVCVCKCKWPCATVHLWRSENNRQCQPLPLILRQISSFSLCVTQASWASEFPGNFLFPPPISPWQHWAYGCVLLCPAFCGF